MAVHVCQAEVATLEAVGELLVIEAMRCGLEASEGELVARMDADDVSHPDRLARQVATLEEDSSLGAQAEACVLSASGSNC